MINRKSDINILDTYTRQIDDLHAKSKELQTQLKVPTIPIYDSKNWPGYTDDTGKKVYDAAYGQLVRDQENYDTAWMYQPDDKWHPIGGVARARVEMTYDQLPKPFWSDSVVGPGGAVGPGAIGETIINFDHGYNPYPGVFALGPAFNTWVGEIPSIYPGWFIYCQQGGVYSVTYRLIIDVDYSTAEFTDTPLWTQCYEPDWTGWVGYDTWHGSVENGVQHTIVFVVSNDVAELWPAGTVTQDTPGGPVTTHWPMGQPIYCTAWIPYKLLDGTINDDPPQNLYIVSPTQHELYSGDHRYQGSYLEVTRLGGTNTEDITAAGEP